MQPQTALLALLAAAFGVAFLFGFAAAKLRMPPLVGYLVAGLALGPISPLSLGDTALASQLAEVGVILLMFGVGLHFSPGDLQKVRAIAVPGALLQMAIAMALGYGLGWWWGWTPAASLLLALSLCTASTVVMLRMLEDRGLVDSAEGQLAIGWLVVQDLAVVLVLVLLPTVLTLLGVQGAGASDRPVPVALGITLVQVVAFFALMAVVGRRVVPWLLTHVVRTGSRELFTLAILVVSLGIAVGASVLFGISFSLGAFVAGVVISESELSYRAGTEALPMQEAFSVIFFVSAGMLIDPTVLFTHPGRMAAVVGVVLLGNAVAGAVLMAWLRHPVVASIRLGAGLGQIGEFSFILATLGGTLGVLDAEGRSLIMAGALVTIVGNPALFKVMESIAAWLADRPALLARLERHRGPREVMTNMWTATPFNHVILIGYGRVGRMVGDALLRSGDPFIAIDQDRRTVEAMRMLGVNAVFGDATRPATLTMALPELARLVVITTRDPYRTRHLIELMRARNPTVEILVRTHSEEEQQLFEQMGVSHVLMADRELAYGMAYQSLRSVGASDDKADWIIATLRGGGRTATQEFSAMTPPSTPAIPG